MNQQLLTPSQLPRRIIWLLDRLICSWLIVAALIGSYTLFQWYKEANSTVYQTVSDVNFENLSKEQLEAIKVKTLQALDSLKQHKP